MGSAAEGRALQFFCEIAGPFLPGVTDPYFWTQLVMQFSSFEPAVRHSVVAISSLYEQSQAKTVKGVRIWDNSLALRHYNAAIAELKTMDNPSLVLLVCILFICIEFLQSNRAAAIRHCKHGIYILQNNTSGPAWVREHLVPLFRRLSVFPFFFGTGSQDFPSLVALENPIPESFADFAEARSMMDDIFSRTIRLVRCGDAYRFGSLRHSQVPPVHLVEQDRINYRLDQWRKLFGNLDTKSPSPNLPGMEQFGLGEEYLKSMLRVYLLVSFETCRIWVNMAFSGNETGYDRYLASFRRLIQYFMELNRALPPESRKHKHYPKFIFEMGFMPMTFFVTTKCRALELRLASLALMRLFGVPQENLWQVDISYEVARRVIEIEHGMVLDPEGRPLTPPSYPGLPPDELRVRDTRTDFVESMHTDDYGQEMRARTVHYYMCSPEDTIWAHVEIFPLTRSKAEVAESGDTRRPWRQKLQVRSPPPKVNL